jgi:hypothetical protein
MEEDMGRWKDLSCSWTGRINTMKMTILSKATHMFNTICIKIPKTFLPETENINPIVYMQAQKAMSN